MFCKIPELFVIYQANNMLGIIFLNKKTTILRCKYIYSYNCIIYTTNDFYLFVLFVIVLNYFNCQYYNVKLLQFPKINL